MTMRGEQRGVDQQQPRQAADAARRRLLRAASRAAPHPAAVEGGEGLQRLAAACGRRRTPTGPEARISQA